MSILRTIWHLLTDGHYRHHLIYTTMLVFAGSSFYYYYEGWSWVDAIYFSVITLTTVGYGDISPQTDGGKIFTIFYIIIGIGIILSFLNMFAEKFMEHRNESIRRFRESKWDFMKGDDEKNKRANE